MAAAKGGQHDTHCRWKIGCRKCVMQHHGKGDAPKKIHLHDNLPALMLPCVGSHRSPLPVSRRAVGHCKSVQHMMKQIPLHIFQKGIRHQQGPEAAASLGNVHPLVMFFRMIAEGIETAHYFFRRPVPGPYQPEGKHHLPALLSAAIFPQIRPGHISYLLEPMPILRIISRVIFRVIFQIISQINFRISS